MGYTGRKALTPQRVTSQWPTDENARNGPPLTGEAREYNVDSLENRPLRHLLYLRLHLPSRFQGHPGHDICGAREFILPVWAAESPTLSGTGPISYPQPPPLTRSRKLIAFLSKLQQRSANLESARASALFS